MNVKGFVHPLAISLLRSNRWRILDRTKAQKKFEVIYKEEIYSKRWRGSVEILYVSPRARVKKHKHENETELYLCWDNSEKCFKHEICTAGNYHSLRNTSDKNWAVVLSVKFYDKKAPVEE